MGNDDHLFCIGCKHSTIKGYEMYCLKYKEHLHTGKYDSYQSRTERCAKCYDEDGKEL